jgi:hypothetical protein
MFETVGREKDAPWLGPSKECDHQTTSGSSNPLEETPEVNRPSLIHSIRSMLKLCDFKHRIWLPAMEQVNHDGITELMGGSEKTLENNWKVNQYTENGKQNTCVQYIQRGIMSGQDRQSIHPLNQHRCTSAK